METLTASSVKVFLENHRDKDCVFIRSEIRSLGFQKYGNKGFSLSVSIPAARKSSIQPFSSARAVSSSETTQTRAEDEEMEQTIDGTQTKTVHVKFQLQMECSFGQQFLIVGDDPMFGLWDPTNAVPLNWSEGHIWTVELDMPCDKMIKYKFILKGDIDEEILWQPDPDRVLQTWETSKTITVSVDWENAELQTIAEEDPISDELKESLEDSAEMIVTENLPQPGGDPWNDMNTKPTHSNGSLPLAEKPMAIVAENVTQQSGELEAEIYGMSRERIAKDSENFVTSNFENNALSIRNDNFTLSKDEKNLDFPVLVPGLTPTTSENQEASVEEFGKNLESDASFGSNIAEEFGVMPEPKSKAESGTCLPTTPKEETGMHEKRERQEKEQVEGHVEKFKLVEHNEKPDREMKNDVLENDIQWGRRTLQKFLATLGLL